MSAMVNHSRETEQGFFLSIRTLLVCAIVSSQWKEAQDLVDDCGQQMRSLDNGDSSKGRQQISTEGEA